VLISNLHVQLTIFVFAYRSTNVKIMSAYNYRILTCDGCTPKIPQDRTAFSVYNYRMWRLKIR